MTENPSNTYYTKKKLGINMQVLPVSEVSCGPYCNCIVISGTEFYAANLIFIRQLQPVESLVPVLFHSK